MCRHINYICCIFIVVVAFSCSQNNDEYNIIGTWRYKTQKLYIDGDVLEKDFDKPYDVELSEGNDERMKKKYTLPNLYLKLNADYTFSDGSVRSYDNGVWSYHDSKLVLEYENGTTVETNVNVDPNNLILTFENIEANTKGQIDFVR